MAYLYHVILHQPILNTLIFFYQTIAFQDLGLAIIFVTILVRLILFPIFQKSIRHQMVMQRLQPEVKKIQESHRHNLEKQSKTIMALYREHRVNPFSGFLFLIIQIPILIALYRIFSQSITPAALTGLYSFVSRPEGINTSFLGLINLEKPSIFVAGAAVLAQYLQSRLALKKHKEGEGMPVAERLARRMAFVGSGITLVFLLYLPAAVGIYWLTTSLVSILQQGIVNKQLRNGKLGNLLTKPNHPSPAQRLHP